MKTFLRLLFALALSPVLYAQNPDAPPTAARSVTLLSGPGWKLFSNALEFANP